MTKKQKLALKNLQQLIETKYETMPVTIGDVVTTARTELKWNVLRFAAVFELRKDDFRRFYHNGFTPPYFSQAFRRYFNIEQGEKNA
jgi:hypothetical protein